MFFYIDTCVNIVFTSTLRIGDTMSYTIDKSQPLETREGLIYIAFVGVSDEMYTKMTSTIQNREGYGFVRVDTLDQIDNLSFGDVDAIVVPAESKFTSMTQSTASIIRVTSNKGLLEDSRYQDAYIISDEQIDVKPMYKNIGGKTTRVEVPWTNTDEAMDYIVESALFKRRSKLLIDFKEQFPTIVGLNGELDEERLLELYAEKDATALGHVKSVASLVSQMGFGLRELGVEISDDDLEKARKVGLIHDIGKLYTPDQLLKNTDDFTAHEFSEMKKHALLNFNYAISEEISSLIKLAEQHHFRFDGDGYLEQTIEGEEIPLISRMMITLDAFDAITDMSRGYQKQAMNPVSPLENAISILYNNSNKQFDPLCSQAFLIGFKNAFENDPEFRNEWLAKEEKYFEQRNEYLKLNPNPMNQPLPAFDPVARTEHILNHLDTTELYS